MVAPTSSTKAIKCHNLGGHYICRSWNCWLCWRKY